MTPKRHRDQRFEHQHGGHRGLQRARVKCRLLQQGCRNAEDDDEIWRGDEERAQQTFLVEPLHGDFGEHRHHAEQHADRRGYQQRAFAALGAGAADHTAQHTSSCTITVANIQTAGGGR